jgi:hypothetical protein
VLACFQVTKVPSDVQKQRSQEAKKANAARFHRERESNTAKTRMKGKNRATLRHRKRQENVIEVRFNLLHYVCLMCGEQLNLLLYWLAQEGSCMNQLSASDYDRSHSHCKGCVRSCNDMEAVI